MSKYWFKRKRYGWGWTPTTWQGWLVIGLYAAVIIAGSYTLRGVPHHTVNKKVGYYIFFVLVATLLLLQVVYKTAPSPKLRWGKKDDDHPDEDF